MVDMPLSQRWLKSCKMYIRDGVKDIYITGSGVALLVNWNYIQSEEKTD